MDFLLEMELKRRRTKTEQQDRVYLFFNYIRILN